MSYPVEATALDSRNKGKVLKPIALIVKVLQRETLALRTFSKKSHPEEETELVFDEEDVSAVGGLPTLLERAFTSSISVKPPWPLRRLCWKIAIFKVCPLYGLNRERMSLN